MRAQEMQNIFYKAEEWSLGAWYLLSCYTSVTSTAATRTTELETA